MIKNAKFSGYYFDMNLIIWGDFQICISVPLTHILYKELASLKTKLRSNCEKSNKINVPYLSKKQKRDFQTG